MHYYSILVLLLLFACGVFGFFFSSFYSKSKTVELPPGPKRWPVVGNIFLLGDKPHQSLSQLSRVYGPIMSLKLGTVTTIVLSSPDLAKEMYLKHDLALSSRRVPDSMQAEDHLKFSVVWLPVSNQWRNLRKIMAIQLFSPQRLDSSQCLRQEKVRQLLEHLSKGCGESQAVDIGRAGFTTVLNLLSNTLFSFDLVHYNSEASQEFKHVMWSIMELIGRPNLADYFPVLRFADPQGVRYKTRILFRKLIAIFDDIIKQRLYDPSGSSDRDDVLENLLSISKDSSSGFSMDELKHLLLDLFVAGSDTTSGTFEWAMTELLRNHEKMMKVQVEIDNVVGKNAMVRESDIIKLPYLQATVKETFRLHPPGPFLIPKKAESDIELCGYLVPKGSQVMVNIWSMSRDVKVWPNPTLFSPERFLNRDVEMKGGHFELIPFGAGRRICPGYTLAYRMLHLMLANVLHSFNWKLADGMSPDAADIREKFGITLHKAEPLKAVPLAK